MGAVSGVLGLGGGASGSGFAAPSFGGNAPINPFDPNAGAPQQITDAYSGVQGSLKQQQDLLKALQAQNGLGNQSQVYNQLQGVVNGTGPNPAQAMLNQQTGTNVANQAALMAGQRGAGANVGLLARQIAQQGANTQQQAVGQGASMQAEQSLNALANSGTIAGNQASNQINAVGANTTAQQNEQQTLLNSLAGYNSTNAGLQANINSANASLANTSMQGQQGLVGGLLKGAGVGGGLLAEGGIVGNYASGGSVQSSTSSGPQSSFVQYLSSNSQMPNFGGSPDAPSIGEGSKSLREGASNINLLGKNKQPDDPAQVVAGGPMDESGMDGPATMVAAQGGMTHDYRIGGNVKAKKPSEKAVVQGNSYSNDKIPAVLSEGEVVIPRDVMQSKDPVDGAARFVAEMMKRKKKG